MKKLLLMLMASCCALLTFAQKETPKAVEVSGEYTYLVPSDMSLDEAKKKVVEAARNEAIGRKFGWLTTDDSKMMDVETDTDSQSYFSTFITSAVKGLWLNDIDKPVFKTETDEVTGGWKVHVAVRGMARELVSVKIDLDTKLLRNVRDKSESLSFVSDENFYLSFKSPESGYLTVYLVDEKGDAFCLLPYSQQESGSMPVKANRSYVFFSEQMATDECKSFVDEYFFFTDKNFEENKLYILFSPDRLVKANDAGGRFSEQLNSQMPREVKAEDFHKWLTNLRLMDSYLQVIEKNIELRK